MVFLTSPNNPDGSMIAEEDLLAMLKLPVLVVLDEAYIEFSEEPSRLRWVLGHPNLVIVRTFSKSAGLAGLRVGYGRFQCWVLHQYCSDSINKTNDPSHYLSAVCSIKYCVFLPAGAFPSNLIEYLWRAKQPYNVSVAAETAACAALTNPDYLQVSLLTNTEMLAAGIHCSRTQAQWGFDSVLDVGCKVSLCVFCAESTGCSCV